MSLSRNTNTSTQHSSTANAAGRNLRAVYCVGGTMANLAAEAVKGAPQFAKRNLSEQSVGANIDPRPPGI